MFADLAMKVGGIFGTEEQTDVRERRHDGVQASMQGFLYGPFAGDNVSSPSG